MDDIPDPIDVLVVGAGPTGLAAAADALRLGLTVEIVERRPERAPYSKALVVHARTMEVLDLLGCADDLLARGQRFRALHVHTRPGRRRHTIDLVNRRWGDTRYPFWLSVPQYETERVLEARVAAAGVDVAWSTELIALEPHPDHVDATVRRPDGTTRRIQARWVLGCDGGRSTARDLAGLTLDRRDLGVSFALADVHTTSDLPGDEGHMVWSDEGLLLIVPMPEPGVWRLIAHADDDLPSLTARTWDDLVARRAGWSLGITEMGWSSRFRLSSGTAARLRAGRVFLLGDAAHVHSPVGGQGLNTGIQDAHNLMWKLAIVASGRLSATDAEALIDTYEAERHPIVSAMVRITSLATRFLTVRLRPVLAVRRAVAGVLLRIRRVKDRLGRGVGMLDLKTGGAIRLPDPEVAPGVRRYDRVRPTHPTLLQLDGTPWLVRPDRVTAPEGTWPSLDAIADHGEEMLR